MQEYSASMQNCIDFGELHFYKEEQEFLEVKEIFDNYDSYLKSIDSSLINYKESRAIATFTYSAIGDALGSQNRNCDLKTTK